MKFHPKSIYDGKKLEYIMLPAKEYKILMEAYEDLKDLETIEKGKADKDETFPGKLVDQILVEKKNRIKAFREYRRMSIATLAEAAKVSEKYITEVESNKRIPSAKALKAIAAALYVEPVILSK